MAHVQATCSRTDWRRPTSVTIFLAHQHPNVTSDNNFHGWPGWNNQRSDPTIFQHNDVTDMKQAQDSMSVSRTDDCWLKSKVITNALEMRGQWSHMSIYLAERATSAFGWRRDIMFRRSRGICIESEEFVLSWMTIWRDARILSYFVDMRRYLSLRRYWVDMLTIRRRQLAYQTTLKFG